MARKPADALTGIEIGTSAIKVCIGCPRQDGSISIAAFDETPCINKIMKGEVQDVEAVQDLLADTLNQAEETAGCAAGKVFLAITGAHIGSVNAQGTVPIRGQDRKITEEDIIEATRQARGYRLPIEKIAVNSCQRAYQVDGDRTVSQPLGMTASKLMADIHFVYGNYNNIQTTCSLVDGVLGYPATDISFSGVADVYGLALGAEQTNGVLVVDIGAGVTEYVVYYEEGCMHSGQITVGCEHLANDLSIGLQIPISKARDLLKSHGAAMRRADGVVRRVEVEISLGHEPKSFKESTIQTVIELRLLELFQIICDDLSRHHMLDKLSDGVVLCGGGALIPHIEELARSYFSIPVRIGQPSNVSGEEKAIRSPRCVTPIGLLHLGYQLQKMEESKAVPLGEAMKRDMRNLVNLAKKAIKF